ncbi:MAG: long-chain-acyl-CoA synthetase [Bacteroidetes bacterium]|nr:long-chain-acyl-CoA synthetase [Bacteroidota bacterium]
MTHQKNKYKISITDLIPGVQSMISRLPDIAKAGLSTFTLFNELPYSLGTVLESNARKYPDQYALLFEDVQYTYEDLNQLVNQYAHYFSSIGVRHQTVVIVFLENRPETLIVTAALAKLGAIASLVNPNQRDAVLLHSIQIKHDRYFVIGQELTAAFDAVKSKLDLSNSYLLGVEDSEPKAFPKDYIVLNKVIEEESNQNPESTATVRTKDHLAYIFTSGTTGMPKASIQTHKQWLRSMNWFGNINAGFTKDDTIYVSIPFYHANAFIIGWGSAFANGSTIAMRRKFSASEFWKDIRKFDATAFIYIGEICRYLMNSPPSPLDKKHRVTKIIGNGMRPEIWNDFKMRFNIPNIYEFYAASDSNVIFTNSFNVDNCVGWSPTEFAIVKYDIDNDEVYRNKKGTLEKVTTGEVGLMISKITDLFPFAGYANAAQNESKIFRDVFDKGDQWFNTGDLMRDIGFKHTQFVDRVGDTFRWKGENVATAEVEAILTNFEAIESAAVYGVQIPNCDGRAGMAALSLQTETDDLFVEELYKNLKDKLPAYAIPVFVRICDQLEVTHTQKIKKADLKKEGYDCNSQDTIYVLLPKSKVYQILDDSLLKDILSGKYHF